jgi:hypothetical protein
LEKGVEEEDVEVEDEDVEVEDEHPDLLACRSCGLVFAHAWCLKEHQICVDVPSTNRSPRDAREKTMG